MVKQRDSFAPSTRKHLEKVRGHEASAKKVSASSRLSCKAGKAYQLLCYAVSNKARGQQSAPARMLPEALRQASDPDAYEAAFENGIHIPPLAEVPPAGASTGIEALHNPSGS